MGVGVAQTHTIFFIAAVFLAVTVVGVLNQNVSELSGKLQDRGDNLADELGTDIRIVNDPANVPNNPITLYVLNTGELPIDPTDTVVLIDGQIYTSLTMDVLGTTEEILRKGQVLEIQVDSTNLANGDYEAKVIVAHGVADNLRFTIGLA